MEWFASCLARSGARTERAVRRRETGFPEAPLRNVDISSWQALLSTLTGLALVTLIGVGIRLLVMVTIQQRRERLNRQINERLRTLIAAYKVLGGSFTGDLTVDPTHLRELRRRSTDRVAAAERSDAADGVLDLRPASDDGDGSGEGSDRTRRIRDAVEAALSDIILLGTEEQVRLAATAAGELAAGRLVHTHDLVVSLRNFIRDALDLDPIPRGLAVPAQGPARPSGAGGRGKGNGGQSGAREGEGRGGGGGGGGGGMGGAGMGAAGIGGGIGLGMASHSSHADDLDDPPLSGHG